MNKYYLGIDLGSTTSKAVIVNSNKQIIGRGITNIRADYNIAADISRDEALYSARFSQLKQVIINGNLLSDEGCLMRLEDAFCFTQFKKRLERLNVQLRKHFEDAIEKNSIPSGLSVDNIDVIVRNVESGVKRMFLSGSQRTGTQFFRDLVSDQYFIEADKLSKMDSEFLIKLFDKSLVPVENEHENWDFYELIRESVFEIQNDNTVWPVIEKAINNIMRQKIEISGMIGTGYGRALLPFSDNEIKSEILCHALGAHSIFPRTRTVLDIGGQDTKAIQVDSRGLVTSFNMNDRCAAGSGRYLGYVADEMGLSLNELGPLALKSGKEIAINSTCTVFAGAEVRGLLNAGESREDILAGLHKSIVLRALSLIARSGGVVNEFSFTGGVARNQAVVKYLSELVLKNYGGDIKINIHPDSIFMGALGAAIMAQNG